MDRLKKLSFGLLKVIPKDENGNPVTNFNNHLVDIDTEKEGVQEAKEWIALIGYIKSFDKNGDGIPAIPARYKQGNNPVVDLAK